MGKTNVMTFSDRPAQGRRSFLLIAAAAALLAGCARGRSTGRGRVGPQVNRVAVLVPLSGPDAAVGSALGNAARLAMLDTGTKAFELTCSTPPQRGAAGSGAERASRPITA